MNKKFIALIRVTFILICCITGSLISIWINPNYSWIGTLSGIFFGLIVIFLDFLLINFSFRGFSKATIGLMIGMFCAWLITQVDFFEHINFNNKNFIYSICKLVIYYFFGYIGIILALRANKEEFSLLIPYVRFKHEETKVKTTILDTNIIIDGRIPPLVKSGFLRGEFIIPRFVIDELQNLINSKVSIDQSRGHRGLENLDSIIDDQDILSTIYDDRDIVNTNNMAKIIDLATFHNARIFTNDPDTISLSKNKDIEVLSLDNLAKAMKPIVKSGDEVELHIIKKGKDDHQGIGFLNDGTMIVVNNSVDKIGTVQKVIVGGALQTSAGRLIFADLKNKEKDIDKTN